MLALSSCGKHRKSKVYLISKMKTSVSQMSSIVPSALVAKPTLGKQKETLQFKRQNTRTSLITQSQPVTSQNIQPIHTHGTLHASRMEGLVIACEKPAINKAARSFSDDCKTVPLGNNLIKQKQVVCKFPPRTTDDDHTVKNVLAP